jgi:hypothetical protein
MVKSADNGDMGMLIVTLLIFVAGPLSLIWGADSRVDSRGFFGRRNG